MEEVNGQEAALGSTRLSFQPLNYKYILPIFGARQSGKATFLRTHQESNHPSRAVIGDGLQEEKTLFLLSKAALPFSSSRSERKTTALTSKGTVMGCTAEDCVDDATFNKVKRLSPTVGAIVMCDATRPSTIDEACRIKVALDKMWMNPSSSSSSSLSCSSSSSTSSKNRCMPCIIFASKIEQVTDVHVGFRIGAELQRVTDEYGFKKWYVGSSFCSENVQQVLSFFVEMMKEKEKTGECRPRENTESRHDCDYDGATEGNGATLAVRKLLCTESNSMMDCDIDPKGVLATEVPPLSSSSIFSRSSRRRSSANTLKAKRTATKTMMMLQQGTNFTKHSSSGRRSRKRVLWIDRSRLFWAKSRSARLAKSLPLSNIIEVVVDDDDDRHEKRSFSLRLKANSFSSVGGSTKLIRLVAETELDCDRWVRFLLDVSLTNEGGPSPQGQERDHITDDDEENGGKENEETFLGKVCNNGME
eukprot:CAMPEP_0185258852 /NCGR_PEP_ID=MMETSP1359-20130426/7735_1 /TAXON_ID=552665 /ORGANISM="Bigelowiella longifila, Strain CCMP242" /LENGTH=474 /DNA_ID=CAMNT_0027844533 /DNA_START=45 /DNA_END=1468 /DNA_ORIENTATION=-